MFWMNKRDKIKILRGGVEEMLRIVWERNNSLELFCNEANEIGGGIFLYGAGTMLYDAFPCVKKCGLKIQGILDADENKIGKYFMDVPIVSLEEVMDKLYDSAIAITTEKFANEINKVVSSYLPAHRIFRTSMYPLGAIRGKEIFELRQYYIQNIDRLSEVYVLLADQESRTTFRKVLDGWLSFQGDKLAECVVEPQYFIPQLVSSMENISSFIDIGAYIGDTIDDALYYIPQVKRIYAFEADQRNYEKLIARHGNNPRVKAYRVALSDCDGEIFFSSGFNTESRMTGHCIKEVLNDDVVEKVSSIRLDAVDEILNMSVSFIKIDVEGNEMDVLKGAAEIICRDRPKLAVCVYHKNQDIIEIPLWIHSIVPEYKFLLRQHSIHGTDTVLYAI